MYSIDLGLLTLEFEAALSRVPRDGVSYDWMNDDWVDEPQQIDIAQAGDYAVVDGVKGPYGQTRSHRVAMVSPPIYRQLEVCEYLLRKVPPSGRPHSVLLAALQAEPFSWGTLISFNWTALGYAPGGKEYCLLPADGPAIEVGLLRLDWTTVRIRHAGEHSPSFAVAADE